ncbi:putative chaperone protein [Botrytis cinerea BcDW1]|uniref:Putative chaperone protein n=1 Tax=Botryotinia fuckeliana (strain BcDW1) TaxID=1290391 RepID=M7TS66_BOTF1|nr:putative chaperone protein [Botrytis cinerea BcDW1]
MASSEELSGLVMKYSEPKKGPSNLTIYELYQVEQYEAQELFEFEQYVKIIRFAEAVCSGTHPRFGAFPQPGPGAHMTGAEASNKVDVEPKKIGFEELETTKGLNSMRKAGRKKGEKEYFKQTIMKAEDLHGARYIDNSDMDYYEVLSLEPSASIEDINRAYSELRWTHNPQSDEGKTKWRGKEPIILQNMQQEWNNIQRAFIVLSDHHRKYGYDNDREMQLKGFERKGRNLDESTTQSNFGFAAFREEVVRSIEVPHPDDPPEPYNEDFFKSITKDLIVEEKDIDYDKNYYHDLGANDTKKSSSWNGVISGDHFGSLLRSMGYDHIRNLRQAKDEKAINKVRSEWNQKLISYMILKDEKLRKKYNEHNYSHKIYEYLQKEHDSKEFERVHNSQVLVSEKMERRGKDASSQPAITGNYFQRLSTETKSAFIKDASDDGTSASTMMTRVEQNTEIDYSVIIAHTEKVSDRIQVNPATITDRIPKSMSQAFSISKVPLRNNSTNQKSQSSSGALMFPTLQRKLLQARKVQAQRVVQEKQAQAKLSVQVTEPSATFSKQARTLHPAVPGQVPNVIRDQQAFVQKQLNAQRAAVQSAALHHAEIQRSLGLDRAPPTGPRVSLGMAPRLMTSSFAHSLNSTSPSKSCPRLELKMSHPPMMDKISEVAGSPSELSKSSEKRPAKKKRRLGDRECDGKKEKRRVNKGDASRSGVEMKLQDEGRTRTDPGEKSSLKEDGEISEDESEREADGRQRGKNRSQKYNGGKKRKREYRRNSWRPAEI